MASPQLGGLNSSQGKNFFNAANDFQKPSSKARIESRKGVLSRKSSINKNSFYRSKAVGKVPDYLPNKPTVVGSRGQHVGSGYLNRNAAGSPKLPNLNSSGGIAGNSASGIKKNSAVGGARGGQANFRGIQNANIFNKYTSGLGGGIAGGAGIGSSTNLAGSPYNVNYTQNHQGEQGSIGSSGSLGRAEKPTSGLGRVGSGFALPAVSNPGKSRGGQGSAGKPALGSSGRKSRGPGVSSLQNRLPPAMNANSGAGFKSGGAGSGSPYGGSSLGKAGAGSLNTNVFNIPKYGALGGGLGGGIGGSYGSSLGGGIAGGLGRGGGGPVGSAGAGNK